MRSDLTPGQRLVRLLRMAHLLSARPLKRRELANLFGVSERTIQDDLAVLRRAGFEVVSSPWRGYRIGNVPPLPVADRLAPGFVVSVQGSRFRLVWLAPKGMMTWIEEEVEPQPPEPMLWDAVPPAHRGRRPRGLYPLTPALAEWVRKHVAE